MDRVTFAPSISKLRELDESWDPEHTNLPSWIAWEFLRLVEWCWITPFSFFDGKSEKYDDYHLRNASIQLISLHSYWLEIEAIKKHNYTQKHFSFFTRELFLKIFKLILDEIILEQESQSILIKNNIVGPEILSPYSVKLRWQRYTDLVLEVYWFDNVSPTIYLIYRFHDGSKRHKFMTSLTQASINQPITIEESKWSIAKYLNDAGLNNIVGDLFFKKINTLTASRRRECIVGSDISKSDRQELKNCIKSNFKEIQNVRNHSM